MGAANPSEREAQALRCFLALPMHDFSSEVADTLKKLKNNFSGVRWVNPAQIHITLHFFGSIAKSQITSLSETLTPLIGSHQPLELSLGEIGFFPNSEKPRVLWVGIQGDIQRLKDIQKEISHALSDLGYPIEDRDFQPHLTLGRAENHKIIQILKTEKIQVGNTQNFRALSRIILYQSTLTSAGPVYETIKAFPFSKKF